ncbi:MAG: PAS domain-containing protein, partial [Treponema sp.]|nr:PAS domain-containing protein [Treponema sp.]
MRSYVNRVAQISSKLTKEQIISLLDKLVDENEDLRSILESINCGLLILDKNFCLRQNNTVVLSKIPFSVHPEDSKTSLVPIWEIIDDEEVSAFFKKCYEKSVTNSTEEFTLSSSTGVKFISIVISPLVHNGNLSGSVVLVRDITEKKNQEVL